MNERLPSGLVIWKTGMPSGSRGSGQVEAGMNEHIKRRHQLPVRKPARPGDLQFWTGILFVLAAPFVLYAVLFVAQEHVALKSHGIVSEAVVKAKSVLTESYTDRKGRPKTRAIYNVSFEHDINAATTYPDWKSTGVIAIPNYPATSMSDAAVPRSYFDDLAIGETTTIVRDPNDYSVLLLVEQLEYETSMAYYLKWYLGLGAVFLAGVILTLRGWRKRRAQV